MPKTKKQFAIVAKSLEDCKVALRIAEKVFDDAAEEMAYWKKVPHDSISEYEDLIEYKIEGVEEALQSLVGMIVLAEGYAKRIKKGLRNDSSFKLASETERIAQEISEIKKLLK